jgi:hypothetical protein
VGIIRRIEEILVNQLPEQKRFHQQHIAGKDQQVFRWILEMTA